jgi:hypothetical protein
MGFEFPYETLFPYRRLSYEESIKDGFTSEEPILVFREEETRPYSLDKLAVNNLTGLIKALPKYFSFFKKYYENFTLHKKITIPDEIELPREVVNEGWTFSGTHKNSEVTLNKKIKIVQLGVGDFNVDYGTHSYFFDKDTWYDDFTPSKGPHHAIVSAVDALTIVGAMLTPQGADVYDGFSVTLGVPRDEEHHYERQKVTSLQEIVDLVRAGADL